MSTPQATPGSLASETPARQPGAHRPTGSPGRSERAFGWLTARYRRLFALSLVAFFLMIGAWAVATPYDATADEHDHLYRAAGVWSGSLFAGPAQAVRGGGSFQRVPAGIVRSLDPNVSTGPCCGWITGAPVTCAEQPAADRTPVLVPSGAGRYNPIYYLAVGLPLKLWPGWSGVILARLLSAALGAALLAGALTAIVRYSRHRLMVGGLLIAVTPMTLHFTGAVNPNGVEITAGIALFTALSLLLFESRPDPPHGLLALAGISAIALATLRPTGLMYLGVALVGLVLPFRSTNARTLWRSRAVRWWSIGIVVASVAAVVWIAGMKSMDLGSTFTPERHVGIGEATVTVVNFWSWWFSQMIGLFNWLELALPAAVYVVWELLFGALFVFGLVLGTWVDRWRLAVVVAGGLLLPSALQIMNMNNVGMVTQGRYMLPMLVGLPLLGAYIMETRGLSADASRSFTKLAAVVLLAIQMFALSYNMIRYQRGLPPSPGLRYLLNPISGSWHPVVSSWTPLIAMAIGLVGLGWLAWRSVGGDAPAEPATAD